MYDKLIADLKEDAEWAAANEWETPIMLSDHIKQAVEAIEELSKEIDTVNEANTALYGALPKWIPISEQLPEKYGTYIVATVRKAVMVCCYYTQAKNWNTRAKVAWWMPYPTPPTEDENNV